MINLMQISYLFDLAFIDIIHDVNSQISRKVELRPRWDHRW